MHKWQRHKFCESAGFLLEIAHGQQMSRPMFIALHMTEHDRSG